MLQKKFLRCFLYFWEEGYQKILSLIYCDQEELHISTGNDIPSRSRQVYDWVRDPYSEFAGHPDNLTLKELQCDRTLKMKFKDLSLDKFWISVKGEFATIYRKALNISLQFSTSYMYEQSFPYLASIKSKDGYCLLSSENEIRVCVCLQFDLELNICVAKDRHRLTLEKHVSLYQMAL